MIENHYTSNVCFCMDNYSLSQFIFLVTGTQDFLLIVQRFLSRSVFLSAEGVVPTEHGPILTMTHDCCYLGFSNLIWRLGAMWK